MFDRKAPGGGMEIYCDLQIGKAVLEWKFYCTEAVCPLPDERDGKGRLPEEQTGRLIRLCVWDREGNLALEAVQLQGEEELLRTIMLHPRLWNSTRAPYLYRAEALLEREGHVLDRISCSFPIRSFRHIPGKGWLLNGEPFVPKAVRLEGVPDCARETEGLLEQLALFQKAGANTLCIEKPHEQPASFYELCEERGFVVWASGSGKAVDGRKLLQGGRSCALFYQCRAAWSEEPFVYIHKESLKRMENGNFCVCVYSNQKKVALYADGLLFEFQSGEREFLFQEIPFRSLFLCLTAEAGECTMSLSIHRTFTKASLFHDNSPIE